ncbi:MAG: hypothetical protein ACC608_06670 [Anaerofustis sp.]
MDRKTLQTLELCLAALAVGNIVFIIFAYGFSPDIIIYEILLVAYALLMRNNAVKAAAVSIFVRCAFEVWGVAKLIDIAINWNWGNGISGYILPIIMAVIGVAMSVFIGIATLGRVKNRQTIVAFIGVAAGEVLYSLIAMISTVLDGGTNNFQYIFGSLLSNVIFAFFILIAVGSLFVKDQTAAEGHNEAIPS